MAIDTKLRDSIALAERQTARGIRGAGRLVFTQPDLGTESYTLDGNWGPYDKELNDVLGLHSEARARSFVIARQTDPNGNQWPPTDDIDEGGAEITVTIDSKVYTYSVQRVRTDEWEAVFTLDCVEWQPKHAGASV